MDPLPFSAVSLQTGRNTTVCMALLLFATTALRMMENFWQKLYNTPH